MKFMLRNILYLSFLIILIIIGCRQSDGDGSDLGIIGADVFYEEKISVTQPTENEYFNPGDTINIKWDLFSDIVVTDIFLYRKNQSQFAIIQNNNKIGSYSWIIPFNIRPSLHYSVKVVNSSNPKESNFSGSFSIVKK